MTEHRTGTREEWQAAREALLKRENEHAQQSEELAKQRQELPWVAVEKEYVFDAEDGKKTLAELFDGRSQLLAYNIMFGPEYTAGACPGCSNLADHLDAALVHLNHRDVTLLCFSRAPLEKLQAYKQRMGWKFPYVSTYGSDFPFDFDLALTEEQMADIDEVREMIEQPPDWLQDWAVQVGTDLEHGLAEGPGWIAFALDDGVVYHTYTQHGARPGLRRALLPPAARPHAEGTRGRLPRLAPRRVRGNLLGRRPTRKRRLSVAAIRLAAGRCLTMNEAQRARA